MITSEVVCKDVEIKGLKPYLKGEIIDTDKDWQLKSVSNAEGVFYLIFINCRSISPKIDELKIIGST